MFQCAVRKTKIQQFILDPKGKRGQDVQYKSHYLTLGTVVAGNNGRSTCNVIKDNSNDTELHGYKFTIFNGVGRS